MSEDKIYTLIFTEEELQMVYDVFDELAKENLHQWTTLIPKKGEYRSTECYQQWLLTGKFNKIRRKASIALGYEEDKTKEQILKEVQETIEEFENDMINKIFEGKL